MNKILISAFAIALLSSPAIGVAQNQLPPVDFSAPTQSPTSPFGAFRLVQCDGPRLPPNVGTAEFYSKFQQENGHAYVPCDFAGLVRQVNFLLSAALALGVLAAIIGFVYAGYLYMTGRQDNLKKAHSIFPKIFWGFILMLTAWFIVSQILRWLTPDGSSYLQ